MYDVVIAGGGPAGLSAALTLGRARKRVLLCDGGPRRNAAAVHVHNFVTRDGTPPDEFRRIARGQLAAYPVDARDVRIGGIAGARGRFAVTVEEAVVEARRVLLCTGMVDGMLPIGGFRELWGRSIFQCPYCHGWEVRDRRWAYLALPHRAAHLAPFSLMLRGWTRDVTAFTGGAVEVPADARAKLDAAGVRVETGALRGLRHRDGALEAVELADGTAVPCDVLFVHPPQEQVSLVTALGVDLDDDGYVRVDPATYATSVAGVYAAGDLMSRMQGATIAAAAGTQAAGAINLELTAELATARTV